MAHAVGRFFYDLFHHIWAIAIVVACVLVYLWAVGLPSPVTRSLLGRIDTGPFRLEMDRIRIDPRDGLVGEGIRFYEDGASTQLLVQAQAVALDLDWVKLCRRGQALQAVQVRNGTLNWPEPGRRVPVQLTNMTARILFEAGALRITDMNVDLFGVPLGGHGVVKFKARPEQMEDPWSALARVVAAARKSPSWFQELCHALDGARHDAPPRGRITFKLYSDAPQSNEVAIVAEGSRTRLRGAALDGWDMEVRLIHRVVVVSNLALRAGGNTLHVGARCDLAAGTVEGRLFSDIPPKPVLRLVPGTYRKRLEQLGVVVRGAAKTELWVGPVEIGRIGQQFGGWVSLQDADLRGVPVETAFVSFRKDGPVLTMNSIKGTVGRGERSGPVEASVTVDEALGEVRGNVNLTCFPDDLIPVMNRHQAAFTRRFEFGSKPARFAGTFAETLGTNSNFVLSGSLQGEDLKYQGQQVVSMDMDIAYSNEVLDLKPFLVERDDGTVSGWLSLNFATDLYDVDLRGDVDPNAVVGAVGPVLTRALSFLDLDGPAQMHAFGRIDGSGETNMDLRVDVTAENVGLEWFRADTCSLGVDAKGGSYFITNLVGTAFGGDFSGTIAVHPEPGQEALRHVLDIRLDNAEFARLSLAFRGGTNDGSAGRLTCTFKGTGMADTNALATLEGSGRVQIREGQLLRTPLFGGLSRMLSAIYPGLGFASQTEFTSDYVIKENKLFMDNAMLGGSVLSIRAKGHYSFDKKLRFTVEVKPLRSGPVAAVLRLLTLPVTKLLMFDLGGTLDDPKWRPTNLPKEMFFIFD